MKVAAQALRIIRMSDGSKSMIVKVFWKISTMEEEFGVEDYPIFPAETIESREKVEIPAQRLPFRLVCSRPMHII